MTKQFSPQEIKKALEEHIACNSKSMLLSNNGITYGDLLDLINRQKEELESSRLSLGLINKRKYYRKFVDDVFRKQKGKELSTPDFDYIYELYFNQQAEIERLQKVQIGYAKAFLDEYADRLKSDFTLAMSDGYVPICEIVDELTDAMKSEYSSYTDFTDLIVEKAIKSFAESFKESLLMQDGILVGRLIYADEIDNLVKEFLNKKSSAQSEDAE